MAELTKAAILDSLRAIRVPDGSGDIVSLGLVSDIVLATGRVMFAITIDPAKAAAMEPIRAAAEAAAKAVPGVTSAAVVLTAEAPSGRRTPPAGVPRPAPRPR